VAISAVLKIEFLNYTVFYNVVPWVSKRMVGRSLHHCLRLFRYWSHRLTHVNRFGGQHVTHHNSEKYNLSVAFRLGWTQHIKIIFFILSHWWGLILSSFICHQIEVLYQFWIHTEYIRKLPAPIEYILSPISSSSSSFKQW
jgi:sterol desaturase/sphingolipid hydroxylase (fatty acid hydroxylase superfamily)